MAKLTAQQREIDNMIKRINNKIRSYASIGTDSRHYQLIESIFDIGGKSKDAHSRSWSTLSGEMTLQTKDGTLQLSRSKAALNMYQISDYKRVLQQLDRMESAAKARRTALKAFKARTGQTPKTAKERDEAIRSEVDHYNKVQKKLEKSLGELYNIEKARGIEFQAHEEIKGKSKGRWTESKTLEEMLDLADKVIAGEDQRIVENVLEGY